VYVIGETAEELALAIPDVIRAGDLATAVARATSAAQPGEVVLLSPACASYDQYANFEQRGEEFGRLVANLPM
jgi:UDP-N-acetylmuramoylalanine--D-glutamate ligase